MKEIVNNNEIALGIDLGTTTTQAAIVDKSGIVKVLPNMDGDLVTPSIVSVANKSPVVGKAAKQDKFFNPGMVGEQFKRYMDQVTEDGTLISLVNSADGTEYNPVTLSAELLHYIKDSAEKLLGQEVKKAVVSVPAYFKLRARQATKDATFIAGFKEVHIVDEPAAAATSYGLAKGKSSRFAVFDFGGGTFDICVLEVKTNGEIEVIATDGNPECGGSNIDEAIFQRVRKFMQQKGKELSLENDLAEWLEVLDCCKEAKEMLARKDSTLIPLRIKSERTSMELTYEQLKEYSCPVINILRQCCQTVLDKAGLKPADIDKVVLVGGSTRLRFVPEIIRDVFGKEPVTDTDPDLAVAKGAAVIAAAYFAKPDQPVIVEGKAYLASCIRTQEIAARDLCVAAITKKDQGDMNEYNVPVIPAGAKLPYEATEYFTPIECRTTTVSVKIIDGKPAELSADYTPVEEAEVEAQPADEENNEDRIEFKISMSVEGLVDIKVRDKLLNKPVPIKFKFHSGLSDNDISQMQTQLQARHG